MLYNFTYMNWWEQEQAKTERREANSRRLRSLRETLKKVREIRTWQLILILFLVLLVAMIFLRENNLGMVKRKDALIAADKTGNITEVDKAAKDLQSYVSVHMNTYSGRIPLQSLYNQATTAAIEAAKPPDIDPAQYTRAQSDCSPTLHASGYRAWAACVAGEVGLGADSLTVDVETPDPDAYYVEFASARWSLDGAGLSLLIGLVLAIVIVIKIIFTLLVKIIILIRSRKLI